MHYVERYHDFSAGHRVCGHENKCKTLHGHNYRVTFTAGTKHPSPGVSSGLDHLGRVIDFSDLKSLLCDWLEDHWDHKMILWDKDPIVEDMQINPILAASVVTVPFNPTAENMAEYLVRVIGPQQLENTGIRITKVKVEETRKCSAVFIL